MRRGAARRGAGAHRKGSPSSSVRTADSMVLLGLGVGVGVGVGLGVGLGRLDGAAEAQCGVSSEKQVVSQEQGEGRVRVG